MGAFVQNTTAYILITAIWSSNFQAAVMFTSHHYMLCIYKFI